VAVARRIAANRVFGTCKPPSPNLSPYFSIVERKALTPNDLRSLEEVENRLLEFRQHYERIAAPFE